MKLIVTKKFDFAHRGCEIKHYAKGAEIDTDTADPELVKVATEENWASKPSAKAPGGKGRGGKGEGGKDPVEPPPAPLDPAPESPPQDPAPQP